ncbi:MAG: ABC transporter permease [Caldilineaceae bacterium]|nr:ABC transporter permease [Caldilineaceae bacterium]
MQPFVAGMRTGRGLLVLTLKRLASRPGLTILALIGIVLAVGLLSSAAFFAQAVDRVILNQELAELSAATNRPAFSTRIYFFPSSRKRMGIEAAERAGSSISGTLSAEIGLGVARKDLQMESGSMVLLPAKGDTAYTDIREYLTSVNIVYIEGVDPHLNIVQGDAFTDAMGVSDVLNAWMHLSLADEMGVSPGEEFELALNAADEGIRMRIAGIWQAADGEDNFWFNPPDTKLGDALLVSRASYLNFIEPILPSRSRFVSWHISLDDSTLNPKYSREYAEGFEMGMAVIDKYLPGANLDISALDPLKDFVQRNTLLTIQLLGFNVPALGFLIYFLIMIAAIIARWQQRETAILVSRGLNTSGVVSIVLLEELILFIVGIPLGIAFGMGISLFMGYTVSFLSFTTLREPVPVSFQGLNWYLIGAGLAVAVLARLIPAVRTARMSIVEAERGRQVQKPFWQRAYLDFLLIVPTWYAYDQLANEGTFANMVQERTAELFSDPLLILVPALFVLTCSLLVMRIFPILMWILDRIAGWTNLLTTHLALRQLERHSQRYINPLLLVIVSLSLGIYTYSMALSLDQWLIDQVRHEVGAGATFEPFIPPAPDSSGGSGPVMDGTGTWIPTVAEFEELPGVTAAARVGNYNAELEVTGGEVLRLNFLAVDRVDFARVAWFRDDFADDSLGGLMNRLALSPNSILVPQAVMGPLNWREGDEVNLEVSMVRGHSVQDQFVIAGSYDQFATIYHQPWTVIGNMDHVFALAGTDFTHNIWLGVDESVEAIELKQAIRRMGIEPTRWRHVPTRIIEEQARMERVGIFGTLSVGFLAAAIMAFLALLVHSYASLQDRMFQFGVLRAVGVMRSQIIGQITIEYIFLTSYGTIAGAVIGSLCSILFSPFFRVTAAVRNPLPPLVPLIAENEIAVLAAVFAAAIVLVEVSVTFQALTRRLFDALRMGYQE